MTEVCLLESVARRIGLSPLERLQEIPNGFPDFRSADDPVVLTYFKRNLASQTGEGHSILLLARFVLNVVADQGDAGEISASAVAVEPWPGSAGFAVVGACWTRSVDDQN